MWTAGSTPVPVRLRSPSGGPRRARSGSRAPVSGTLAAGAVAEGGDDLGQGAPVEGVGLGDLLVGELAPVDVDALGQRGVGLDGLLQPGRGDRDRVRQGDVGERV